MIKGFFRFGTPVIEIPIKGRKIKMLLDTGFNGHMMLPQKVIDKLSLEQIGISDYVTASGDGELAKVYIGKATIFDKDVEIPILSTDADFALAGMELFHNCKIIIERSKDIVEVSRSQ